MILDDIHRAVAQVRAEDAKKKAIPGLPANTSLEIRVGAWDAYCAGRLHEAPDGTTLSPKDLATFEGLPVVNGGGGCGVWVARRP